MDLDPAPLLAAISKPIPVFATEAGAVVMIGSRFLELGRVCSEWWGWRTEEGEWHLVRPGQA